MHAEVIEFLEHVTCNSRWDERVWIARERGRPLHVVEVGALDVNGRARDHMTGWDTWTGVDLIGGPGVDVVGDARTVLPMLTSMRGLFDVAVCTEVLEHDAKWWQIVRALVAAVRPGGLVVITCAGTGREPHAADGSGPPHPDEHYANVPLADLVTELRNCSIEPLIEQEGPPGDSRVFGFLARP